MDLSKVETGAANALVLQLLGQAVKDQYRYMIVDCPPAFNAASAAALIAADDVVIPIKLDAFSLRGMGNLLHQISTMKQINPGLQLAGVLPTMWYRCQQIDDAEKQLQEAGLRVFHHIRRSNTVDKMTWAQDPLLKSSPRSGAGLDYKNFVMQYVGGAENGL